MKAPATPDDGGLICGFRLDPVQPIDIDALKAADPREPAWLHFNMADARSRRWLQEESHLDPEVVEALLEPDPRIHLRTVGAGLIAVLADLHHDFDRDPEGFGKIRLYVDDERLITVRRQRLQTPDRLRRDLIAGGPTITSPGALLEYFLERLASTFAAVITKLGDEVDDIEDEILVGRYQQHGSVLGRMRRNIARLRRQINANRSALSGLRAHVPPALENDHTALRAVIGRMDTIVQDLELIQERTRLLQEEIASRIGEATSRNLAVLSTVTTALLPITLITGIFGMNVGGLPGVNSPSGFRWVMLVILVAIAISLVLLIKRRPK
jgi:zinc transporter